MINIYIIIIFLISLGDPPSLETNGPLYEALGEDYIEETFKAARNAFGEDTELFLNEAFGSYEMDNVFVVKFFQVLDDLLERNIPIDGVGIQGMREENIGGKNYCLIFLF